MRAQEHVLVVLAIALLAACGDAGLVSGASADGGAARDGGSARDGGVSLDGGVASDGGVPSDGGAARDGGVFSDGGIVDAGAAPDGGAPDAGPADGGAPVTASALCPTETMDNLYSGFLPTNPYAAAPAATACVRALHDAIIILGCPSNSDGSASTCQTARVDIGRALDLAGYGRVYIVSGAAAHNRYVEAESLRAILRLRGVPDERILVEPQALHTDENLYYSTLIMEAHGFESALVVSEDPGHLVMTAVCDSNCCVKKGRLTVFDFALEIGGTVQTKKVAHYARFPYAAAVSQAECDQIGGTLKLMCTNQSSRHACAGQLMLP